MIHFFKCTSFFISIIFTSLTCLISLHQLLNLLQQLKGSVSLLFPHICILMHQPLSINITTLLLLHQYYHHPLLHRHHHHPNSTSPGQVDFRKLSGCLSNVHDVCDFSHQDGSMKTVIRWGELKTSPKICLKWCSTNQCSLDIFLHFGNSWDLKTLWDLKISRENPCFNVKKVIMFGRWVIMINSRTGRFIFCYSQDQWS